MSYRVVATGNGATFGEMIRSLQSAFQGLTEADKINSRLLTENFSGVFMGLLLPTRADLGQYSGIMDRNILAYDINAGTAYYQSSGDISQLQSYYRVKLIVLE